MSNKELYVGNLSETTRTKDIEDLFGKIGKVTRCELRGRDFGFIAFDDARDAEDAKKELNGAELHGCRLKVDWARPKRPRTESSYYDSHRRSPHRSDHRHDRHHRQRESPPSYSPSGDVDDLGRVRRRNHSHSSSSSNSRSRSPLSAASSSSTSRSRSPVSSHPHHKHNNHHHHHHSSSHHHHRSPSASPKHKE